MTVTARRLAGVAVLAATTLVYVYGLDRAPVNLRGDEAHSGRTRTPSRTPAAT